MEYQKYLYSAPYKSIEEFENDALLLAHDFRNSDFSISNKPNAIKTYKHKQLENLNRIKKFIDFDKIAPIIHITGSIGKGSILKYIENILRTAQYNTQIYTSPYNKTIYDSIKFNQQDICEKLFNEYFQYVWNICQQNKIYLPYLSLKSIIPYIAFSHNTNADVSLVEVSLGGQYDATNIIPFNELAILSRIDLEHTNFFGNNIYNIAEEKIAITKPGSKVIINQQTTQKLIEYIEKLAIGHKGKIINHPILSGDKNTLNTQQNSAIPIIINKIQDIYTADHKKENINTTIISALALQEKFNKITTDNIINGLLNTKLQGRMEFLSTNKKNKLYNFYVNDINSVHSTNSTNSTNFNNKIDISLDSAHNKAGIKNLNNYIKNQNKYKNIGIIFALSDKQTYLPKLNLLLSELKKHQKIKLTLSKIKGHYGLYSSIINEIDAIQNKFNNHDINIIFNIDRAITHQLQNKIDLLIITGSTYLLRNIYQIL
ncbi:MAG: hypothetical protein AAFO15_01230 [Pseudomonadota bacterium]